MARCRGCCGGSRSQESADRFASELDIERTHPSHTDLCANPNVDIIYVASPHSEHHDMTMAALNAGKHVVCEKAFALKKAIAFIRVVGPLILRT